MKSKNPLEEIVKIQNCIISTLVKLIILYDEGLRQIENQSKEILKEIKVLEKELDKKIK